ncbi:MAG: biotin transporter BioY [Agathobacter rectalis]
MNQTETIDYKHGTTYAITVTALMTAVTCILAPLSIPIGPVPISLTNLAIYISLYLLGWKRGTISYLIYLLIGLVGIPVFSGFTGGPAKLAGPTGGYIIGFIAMAIIAGLVIDHFHQPWLQLIGMIVGTIICYVLGTAWFCFEAKSTVSGALSICVPIYPGDLIKMIIAMLIGPAIKKTSLNINSKLKLLIQARYRSPTTLL